MQGRKAKIVTMCSLLIFISAGVILNILIYQRSNAIMESITLKLVIDPMEYMQTYYFVLRDDATLVSSVGIRRKPVISIRTVNARPFRGAFL